MALDESENGVVTVGNNMKVGNNTVTNQQEQEINNRSGHQQQTTEKTLQTATNGLAANKKMQQTKSGKQVSVHVSFNLIIILIISEYDKHVLRPGGKLF